VKLPDLKTQRLRLRAPEMRDLGALVELLSDYDVAKMLARVPYPYDREGGRAWLETAVARTDNWPAADELPFHIDLNGAMIGCVSFRALQQTPHIGYWLGRPYWGNGYMSEAVAAAVDWLFLETDHNRLISEAMTENPASLKVMEKVGFRRTGENSCQSVARGRDMPAITTELVRADFVAAINP